MEEQSDSKYVSVRVPKVEYEKLKQVREQLKKDPDYSWVAGLALGAMVGLVAGLALKKLAEDK